MDFFFSPIQGFERNSKQVKLFWVRKLHGIGFSIVITLPNTLYLRYLCDLLHPLKSPNEILPGRRRSWQLHGCPTGKVHGHQPSPRGWLRDTQLTGAWARRLPTSLWPDSKKSTRRTTVHRHLQEQLWGEGMSLQQLQMRVLAVAPPMLLLCREKKRKMENQSSYGCFTYIWLKTKWSYWAILQKLFA